MAQNKETETKLTREEQIQAYQKHKAEHERMLATDQEYQKMWARQVAQDEKILLLNDSDEA